MIPLIEKAWELHQLTLHVPPETILRATLWLEDNHRERPCYKTAMTIALHYLILAFHYHAGSKRDVAQEFCGRAARWQAVAREFNIAA
jgi:hypothetical protein